MKRILAWLIVILLILSALTMVVNARELGTKELELTNLKVGSKIKIMDKTGIVQKEFRVGNPTEKISIPVGLEKVDIEIEPSEAEVAEGAVMTTVRDIRTLQRINRIPNLRPVIPCIGSDLLVQAVYAGPDSYYTRICNSGNVGITGYEYDVQAKYYTDDLRSNASLPIHECRENTSLYFRAFDLKEHDDVQTTVTVDPNNVYRECNENNNELSQVVLISPSDGIIPKIVEGPASAVPGVRPALAADQFFVNFYAVAEEVELSANNKDKKVRLGGSRGDDYHYFSVCNTAGNWQCQSGTIREMRGKIYINETSIEDNTNGYVITVGRDTTGGAKATVKFRFVDGSGNLIRASDGYLNWNIYETEGRSNKWGSTQTGTDQVEDVPYGTYWLRSYLEPYKTYHEKVTVDEALEEFTITMPREQLNSPAVKVHITAYDRCNFDESYRGDRRILGKELHYKLTRKMNSQIAVNESRTATEEQPVQFSVAEGWYEVEIQGDGYKTSITTQDLFNTGWTRERNGIHYLGVSLYCPEQEWGKATYKVQVVDSGYVPISGAKATLTKLDNVTNEPEVRAKSSDSDGMIYFRNLEHGNYRLKVVYGDYTFGPETRYLDRYETYGKVIRVGIDEAEERTVCNTVNMLGGNRTKILRVNWQKQKFAINSIDGTEKRVKFSVDGTVTNWLYEDTRNELGNLIGWKKLHVETVGSNKVAFCFEGEKAEEVSEEELKGTAIFWVYDAHTSVVLDGKVTIKQEGEIVISNYIVDGIVKFKLMPGYYSAEVTAEGYHSKTLEFNIYEQQENTMHAYLTPRETVAETGSAKVTVYNANTGAVLRNATVKVELQDGETVERNTRSGSAVFEDLEVGQYTATATATGFFSESATFTVIAGERDYASIKLEPKEEKEAPPETCEDELEKALQRIKELERKLRDLRKICKPIEEIEEEEPVPIKPFKPIPRELPYTVKEIEKDRVKIKTVEEEEVTVVAPAGFPVKVEEEKITVADEVLELPSESVKKMIVEVTGENRVLIRDEIEVIPQVAQGKVSGYTINYKVTNVIPIWNWIQPTFNKQTWYKLKTKYQPESTEVEEKLKVKIKKYNK